MDSKKWSNEFIQHNLIEYQIVWKWNRMEMESGMDWKRNQWNGIEQTQCNGLLCN